MTVGVQMTTAWGDFSNALHGFYLKRTGDDEVAKDLRQEALLKMLERFDDVADEQKRSAWMWSVAHNLLKDHWRSKGKPPQDLPDFGENKEPNLDEAHIRFAKDCLNSIIQSLPEKYREAVVLSDLQGIKQTQIAKQLGLSQSGAKSRVQRGRAMLKERLFECCEFELNGKGQWKNDRWMGC